MGCSNQTKGEFLLGEFGFELQANESYHMVVPIEWTGESTVTIQSIELLKDEKTPISYEEDGIEYEFFSAEPLKQSGIYKGREDIGDIKSLRDFELDGEGKIVMKLSTGDVKKDNTRRVKINYEIDGEEHQKLVKWQTLEQLSTN